MADLKRVLVDSAAVLLAGSVSASSAAPNRESFTRETQPVAATVKNGARPAQSIRVRPKLQLPKRPQPVPKRRDEKSGSTSGRIDDCDTKRGGGVEYFSDASR